MPRPQPPVVVVPGITATHLRDEYPVGPEGVWGILRKSWGRIHLHPDDVRWEQLEPARVRADSVFDFPYGGFIEDLRHDLAPASDEPVPVFSFAYDWRQPLEVVEGQRAALVEEVAAPPRCCGTTTPPGTRRGAARWTWSAIRWGGS